MLFVSEMHRILRVLVGGWGQDGGLLRGSINNIMFLRLILKVPSKSNLSI